MNWLMSVCGVEDPPQGHVSTTATDANKLDSNGYGSANYRASIFKSWKQNSDKWTQCQGQKRTTYHRGSWKSGFMSDADVQVVYCGRDVKWKCSRLFLYGLINFQLSGNFVLQIIKFAVLSWKGAKMSAKMFLCLHKEEDCYRSGFPAEERN